MVNKIGALGAIEPSDLGNRAPGADQSVAAASPAERVQPESFLADRLCMRAHPGRHDDRKAGLARGPGDRQAVRAKVPILGNEEEQLEAPRCAAPAGRQWRGRRGYGIGNRHFAGSALVRPDASLMHLPVEGSRNRVAEV